MRQCVKLEICLSCQGDQFCPKSFKEGLQIVYMVAGCVAGANHTTPD